MIRWRFWNWLSKMGSVSNYDRQVILCLEVEQILGYCTMVAFICWQNHYFGDRRSISVTDIWYYISSRPQTIKTCHQHKQSSTSIISIDVVIYCTRCCLKIIMCFSKNFIFLIHLSSNQLKIIRLIIKFQSIFFADGGQVFANSLLLHFHCLWFTSCEMTKNHAMRNLLRLLVTQELWLGIKMNKLE